MNIQELKEAWRKRPGKASDALELLGWRLAPFIALAVFAAIMQGDYLGAKNAAAQCDAIAPQVNAVVSCIEQGGALRANFCKTPNENTYILETRYANVTFFQVKK